MSEVVIGGDGEGVREGGAIEVDIGRNNKHSARVEKMGRSFSKFTLIFLLGRN